MTGASRVAREFTQGLQGVFPKRGALHALFVFRSQLLALGGPAPLLDPGRQLLRQAQVGQIFSGELAQCLE